MMDGVPVTMNSNTANMNANSAVPTIEGIEEFRIQTNSYSAEYGRSGGGVLTLATKSGTNEFHGSLFEFLRNSKMDSNNYFSNASNRPLGVFQRNEYGGSIGGPRSIRNKTFFFTAYESRAQRSAVNNFYTLPTDLQMQGDFSQTFNAQGQQRVIFDPFSTAPDPARPGQFLRTPFPGNRIPAERLDPVALNAQKYYGPAPEPSGTGIHRTRTTSSSRESSKPISIAAPPRLTITSTTNKSSSFATASSTIRTPSPPCGTRLVAQMAPASPTPSGSKTQRWTTPTPSVRTPSSISGMASRVPS